MTSGVPPHGRFSAVLRTGAKLPGLRRLRRTRVVGEFVDAHYQAQAVEQVWRYVIRELLAVKKVASYRPRGGSVDVFVRHNTSDGNILCELNALRLYDPPPEVDCRLRRLPSPIRIVDLGAHIGLFGARILTLYPGSHLTAFEPDPFNRLLLDATAKRSGRSWDVVGAAASTVTEPVRFRTGGFAESHADASAETYVDAVDVFPYLVDADLVKIDVEGSEWRLLADPRFAELKAAAIILEWHPRGSPSPDPECAARESLQQAGFSTAPVEGAPPGVGMLWAWRR